MGEVVVGEFDLGTSNAMEAQERGCAISTVYYQRRNQELPPYVRSTNGKIYPSRQLSPDARRKRDKRIRIALECGCTVAMIVERMGVSRGAVARVAEKTRHRRKRHRYSQRAWRDRLPEPL